MFLSPANEDSAHVLSRFFRDEETAASTKETVSGAAAAGDTDLDLDDLVERLDTVGQNGHSSTGAEAVLKGALSEAIMKVNQLQANFREMHGGDNSDDLFCEALSGLFDIENTGNVENMKRQAAKKVAIASAREILKTNTIAQTAEVERAQFLDFLAALDADIKRSISQGFGQLRRALASTLGHAVSRRDVNGGNSFINSKNTAPAS